MSKKIELLAEEYIKHCYGNMSKDLPQFGEVKQAFMVGVWQMLHIAKDEDCNGETLDLIENEIRAYQKIRMEQLQDKQGEG